MNRILFCIVATKGIIKSQRRVGDKIEYTVKPNYNFIVSNHAFFCSNALILTFRTQYGSFLNLKNVQIKRAITYQIGLRVLNLFLN